MSYIITYVVCFYLHKNGGVKIHRNVVIYMYIFTLFFLNREFFYILDSGCIWESDLGFE